MRREAPEFGTASRGYLDCMTRTIEDLSIELLQVEDAIRHTSLRAQNPDGSPPAFSFVGPVSDELIELASREEANLNELRGRATEQLSA